MLLRSSSAPILGSLPGPRIPPAPSSSVIRDADSFLPLPSPVRSDVPHPPALEDPHRPPLDSDISGLWLQRAQSDGDLATLRNGPSVSSCINSLADESEVGSVSTSHRKQWTKRISSLYPGSGSDMKEPVLERDELCDIVEQSLEPVESSCGTSETSGRHGTAHDKIQTPWTVRSLHADTTSVSSSGRSGEGFMLDDGELYTSLNVDASGSAVACNAKGCRPLTTSEREKLGPMYMASGLGLGCGGGCYGGNGWSGHGGGIGPDSNSTEAYYQRLLQADPQNPLVLRNYAQYLCEAKGDYKRSEEFYERSILACPNDGEVLSQYAKLLWDVHRDQDRAENYYDQAVQASPDDSHVMASYASFLWESEDTEDEDVETSHTIVSTLRGGSHASSPLIASA